MYSHIFKIILLCFPTLFLLVGCWDKDEVNDLAFILTAGIDRLSEDEIQLTVQIRTPLPQGTSGPGVETKIATGETIFDAMEHLQEKTPRKLFWGHNQAIFISEEIAKEGIREHIDFFARYLETRLRTQVFITNEKMIDIMNVIPLLGSSAGEITKKIAQLKTGFNMDIRKILVMANSQVRTTAIPLLELEPDPSISFRVNGIAIFKKGKMLGKIDDKLTRGALWVRNEIKTASVSFTPKNVEKGHVSFDLIHSQTKIKPLYKNKKWKTIVEIKTEDDIVQNGTKLDVNDRQIRKQLEKQLADQIKERIDKMLEVVQQELSTDILNIGSAIYRKYPKKWNTIKDEWDDIFRELEFDLKVTTEIKRPGSSTKPQGIPKKDVIDS